MKVENVSNWRKLSFRGFFTLAICFFCTYVLSAAGMFARGFSPISSAYEAATNQFVTRRLPTLTKECNIFSGDWIYDESYPLYKSCPFVEQGFRCLENGRQDSSFQKWRWQPHECNIPRFDAQDMLRRLQDLRVVFVGDSMGRTQWESLICLLMEAVSNKSSVYFVNGIPISQTERFLAVHFLGYNVTIEYFRSPFLVQRGIRIPERSPKRVHSTLNLEHISSLAWKWRDADVLVINTGHWWTSRATFHLGTYFEENHRLRMGMQVEAAYQKALRTVTGWVKQHINTTKTEVFFRSYEPSHWQKQMSTKPIFNISILQNHSKALLMKQVMEDMELTGAVLNVTLLSEFRPDGHVFNWTLNSFMDCLHWCLPGVPDTWNELLYTSLRLRGNGVWA